MTSLPSLSARQVMRALERGGFVLRRTTGGHCIFRHPAMPTVLVVVPSHPGELKRGLLHRIVKQSGLSPEEFLRLL